ncbi:hypothetical protein GSI_00474 [Ganoderma sinense ZZ0214-1]|uniref:Uncharacterized protein n=1 Tax=Ganoderma sinense ZZ0214-1 TaxID=1077348 RepID=A0A2G8SSQ1_9APHY|nr:hypothetical protein GSI_00474 [Ganoderma sinense ZZ0214-1]
MPPSSVTRRESLARARLRDDRSHPRWVVTGLVRLMRKAPDLRVAGYLCALFGERDPASRRAAFENGSCGFGREFEGGDK